MKNDTDGGRDRDRDQECRPRRTNAAQRSDHRHRHQRNCHRGPVNGWQRGANGGEFWQQRRRFMRDVKAEQIANLACCDDHRDAGGKPDGDRKGDVFDVSARAQQADGNQDEARNDRCEGQAVVAVPLDHARHKADEGAGRSADLEAAAADQRNDEAAGNRGARGQQLNAQPLSGWQTRRASRTERRK